MSDNIKVVVKVRPLITREIEDKLFYQWRVKNNTLYQIDQNGKDCHQYFTFDKVYDKDAKTSEVYNDIAKPIVEAAAAGFNGTIFAYGQTSSGKTYTMTGTDESPGIIPLAVLNLFDIIERSPDREFLVRVSYVEIYNETLIDLLDTEKKVKIQETIHGIKVDTTEKVATSPDEVLDLMKQGKLNRQTASTNMNDESSRSHSIFQITIESRDHIEGEEAGSVIVSQLNLVDLAGSERAGQTGATGIRFKEGTSINKSLSALALVIKQLSEGQNKHVNYRDSKLTRILQNSLGGNAKTSIICAVTPAALEETISTLQFANRAKAIKNTPEVNAVATDASMIQNLTKQLCKLRTDLENKKNVEQDNWQLQKQIARLQKLIINSFHHRTSTDLMSGARKLCQPRRMTISTLHPIQEDPTPVSSIPKFCTPSLKYNPLSLPSTSDFQPLSCVSEEQRQITPPPRDKVVNFTEEIIEIDSDDSTSDVQTCSPCHKCYDPSKTPPCYLRKNYKEAKKSYKEIIKFTEREKMYSPDVVELMNKLDEKSLALFSLEENLGKLNDLCKEKDKIIENLQCQICCTEGKLKEITIAKQELEVLCKTHETKLTDLEVKFETMMKKSKTREKELLSLLEEKSDSKTFKSTSPVEATVKPINENKFNQSEDTLMVSDKKFQEVIVNLETQLKLKEQSILQLQETAAECKHKIETLDDKNKELQEIISEYKQNVVEIEKENKLFKSEIQNLTTIKDGQSAEISRLNADIDSYNNVIQELQLKLSATDCFDKKLAEISDIDELILNENLIIANNENIQNIIQVLKSVLAQKNEELKKLKTTIKTEADSDKTEDFDAKIKELKDKLKESDETIHKLIQEKNTFSEIEQNLCLKVKDFENVKIDLEKANSQILLEKEKLEIENNKLRSEIKVLKEENLQETNKTEMSSLHQKVNALEDLLKSKDSIINEVNEKQNIVQLMIDKVQEIIGVLSGNITNVPEVIESFSIALTILNENVNNLEFTSKCHIEDHKRLQSIVNKYEVDIIKLQEDLNIASDKIDSAIKEFIQYNVSNEISLTQYDLTKCNLHSKLSNLIEIVRNMKDTLQNSLDSNNSAIVQFKLELSEKESLLQDIHEKINSKTKEIEVLASENENILRNIYTKVNELVFEHHIDENIIYSINEPNIAITVINVIEKLANYIKENISEKNSVEQVLEKTKFEMNILADEKEKLKEDLSKLECENRTLHEKIEILHRDKDEALQDLKSSNKVLTELKEDLKLKAKEIQMIENKAMEWKTKFLDIDASFNKQIHELEIENQNLRIELENYNTMKYLDVDTTDKNNDHINLEESLEKDSKSPPSLLTICCNKIFDAIQPNENTSSSSSNASTAASIYETCSRCTELSSEMEHLRGSNKHLSDFVKELQNINQHLKQEHEDAKKEINLLVESICELQKKIINHRTNLSTLTATTYAENKSLSSQLKFLQHYHNLFYKSCEKDIPEVKRQLQQLMTILKAECVQKTHDRSFSLPNVLETSVLQNSLKYESLDGDLLMLDTNVTLTTCDNTLIANDQSTTQCFDITQTSEVACQTINNKEFLAEHRVLVTQESENLSENISSGDTVLTETKLIYVDSQNSPIKIPNLDHFTCKECNDLRLMLKDHEKIVSEKNSLYNEFSELTRVKNDLEIKYNNLVLEIPSTDALAIKLKNLEKDHRLKCEELSGLKTSLKGKDNELKKLQDENDSLSNQIMENIDEAESLRKELDSLRSHNLEISTKLADLQNSIDMLKRESSNQLQHQTCTECLTKDKMITALQNKLHREPHQKLIRSYSDSETRSRYNKICTLQNELHAGRQDCNELKNEVMNIKNHLEGNVLLDNDAMDLDESIGDSASISLRNADNNIEIININTNMPDIPEERPLDLYTLDKIDCVKYCIEETGLETFATDMRLIDILKLFYKSVITKQSNETENLLNKLKDFEEEKKSLHVKINDLKCREDKICKEVEEKNMYLQTIANIVAQIKNNTIFLENNKNEAESTELVDYFKENFLKVLDKEFGFNSLIVFQDIIDQIDRKYRKDIANLLDTNTTLQVELKKITEECQSATDLLQKLKSELSSKENEHNTLSIQKERIFEISKAVTLDIVKKENNLRELVNKLYQELQDKNLIEDDKTDVMSLPIDEIIPILFNCTLQKQIHTEDIDEKNKLMSELNSAKAVLEEKNKQLHALKDECEKLSELFKESNERLNNREKELENEMSLHNILKCAYDKKVEENEANLAIIRKLTDEVNIIKEAIDRKETAIQALESELHSEKEKNRLNNENSLSEITENLKLCKEELEQLKSVNSVTVREREDISIELQQAKDLIQKYKSDLEKMTSDMLILKETVDQSSNDMENLRLESKILQEQNNILKEQLKEKTNEFLRLEINTKTHQKTAEIQCKMITRLKKEKGDMEKINNEQLNKISELTQALEELNEKCNSYVEEINSLKDIKQSLEERISELETQAQTKSRKSLDVNGDVRSRRQSLYDSMRTFSENEEVSDLKKIESVFKARKCDDMFMDVDEGSNRSTPVRLSRGRDSLASRHEQSEEEGSRCSSVQASRRRRQSLHDARRSVAVMDVSQRQSVDRSHESSGSDADSELSKLRKQLSSCQEELEEWKEKYREVDEECEICAQYLRERDEQCRVLKAEKQALETKIEEMERQLKNGKQSTSSVDVAVNTEEGILDWANLHSVAVDRMSYDAEVEKNKKLTRIVEELRYQKQELKNTISKMETALEKTSALNSELESVKSKLASCQKELTEVKERNRELDEECETCAEYLKEREEQCRKLQEAKKALEIKLMDYQDRSLCMSVRKKRQTLHDRNRLSDAGSVDVATETSDDLLSYQVERDEHSKKNEAYMEEIKKLKLKLEWVSQQKCSLEQQLVTMSAATPLYVSTGSAIVQNQQFTDVMKENQKLKSINAKLMKAYKKSKFLSTNRENEDPAEDINK